MMLSFQTGAQMKLITKIAITVGLTLSSLLIFSLILTSRHFSIVLGLTVLSFLILFAAIYFLIIKRINKLRDNVSNIVSKLSLNKQSTQSNDEIISIQSQVDLIFQQIQGMDHKVESHLLKVTRELQNKNSHLEQELSVRMRSEKMKLIKEYLTNLGRADNPSQLPNGVYFNEILNRAINHANRRQQILAVLLLDIDGFKRVFEKFGKHNCDLILHEIGKRFSNVLRKEDVLAKIDGDEFIILLSDIHKPKFASMVAEKILNICSQLLKIDDHEFNLTTSIGISIFPNDGNTLEALIENADRALFSAKKDGGNRYQFHIEALHLEAKEYIKLESALRQALHNNQLALYYQPKFRLKAGTITGVEALMRWEHPTLGIISPSTFIQLAEESGMMMQIGEWALRDACERIKYWQNDGYEHLTVSLKMSPKQFYHPDIIKVFNKVFETVPMNPNYIELQINEKTIMDNVEEAAIILQNLKAIGVQLSIDHFGTGYTSIRYLKQFPISAIKIDQSYIKGIPNNVDDTAITSAVIALAHQLGLEVIAEGVESAEQIQFLSTQNCDIVQGYFLSHPLSAQKIVLQFKKLQEEVF